MEKLLILIPTYNEKDNVNEIVNLIYENLKNLWEITSILFIDDNSPDGTVVEIINISKRFENGKINLIKRPGKLGLGSAYIEGFKWGIKNNFNYILQMDADLSHNPFYINEIFKECKNFDFIIGSRYVIGGGVKNWGIFRKLLSRGGSLYSKIILGCPINDLTGGFNLWKRNVLENLNLDKIISNGYSFQIEMKYRAYKKGFSFKEVPIIFDDRTKGKSKMSRKIFLEAVINVWKLRYLSMRNKLF